MQGSNKYMKRKTLNKYKLIPTKLNNNNNNNCKFSK